MKAIRSWFTPNPILVKELRSRMRGPRAFITLTIALVIMAGLMIAIVSLLTASANQPGSGLLSPQIGQILFAALLIFEMLLVCTVTPAVTAGAISTEREKQTIEMLQATPLSPARFLWGKLISALSYVFLMIFAAVPLQASFSCSAGWRSPGSTCRTSARVGCGPTVVSTQLVQVLLPVVVVRLTQKVGTIAVGHHDTLFHRLGGKRSP